MFKALETFDFGLRPSHAAGEEPIKSEWDERTDCREKGFRNSAEFPEA